MSLPAPAAFIRLIVAPIAAYTVGFVALTYPAILHFTQFFYTDEGDGLQNVWNIWWVNYSLTTLNQFPWFSDYIHYPYGTTLIGHTLNPFNGFLSIPLLQFVSLVSAHNFIVLFSFVAAGVGAFWLAYYFCRAWFPSFIAGCLFTFSSYHFAHSQGHLQLVSLEFIPIYLLSWIWMIEAPSRKKGVLAGLLLFAVILCDYYYFFYCVIGSLIWLFGQAWRSRSFRYLFESERLNAYLFFIAAASCTSGALVVSLIYIDHTDPLRGAHDVQAFSLDLFGLIVPGGRWRFAPITERWWKFFPGNINEKSNHLGLAVIVMITASLVRNPAIHKSHASWFWGIVLGVFYLLSLGPRLQVLGQEWLPVPMPYAWLETVFPPMRMSGMPVRMVVMCSLASAMLCATALKGFFTREDGAFNFKRPILYIFLAVTLFEHTPAPIPLTKPPTPGYVSFLAEQPDGAIVDVIGMWDPSNALYYQTLHEKPMASGYIARYPKSVMDKFSEVHTMIGRWDIAGLALVYNYRYFANWEKIPRKYAGPAPRLIYEDPDVPIYVYDLIDMINLAPPEQ